MWSMGHQTTTNEIPVAITCSEIFRLENIAYDTELCVGMIYVMHFVLSCDSMFNVFMRGDEYMRQLNGSSSV